MTKESGFFDEEDLKPETRHWKDMPEFVQEDLKPYKSLVVHFESEEDMNEFSRLVKQSITVKTKFIWYPKMTKERLINYKYIDTK